MKDLCPEYTASSYTLKMINNPLEKKEKDLNAHVRKQKIQVANEPED